jgi:hypothetical protein
MGLTEVVFLIDPRSCSFPTISPAPSFPSTQLPYAPRRRCNTNNLGQALSAAKLKLAFIPTSRVYNPSQESSDLAEAHKDHKEMLRNSHSQLGRVSACAISVPGLAAAKVIAFR